MVGLDCGGERRASQVVMLVGPVGSGGNLIGERRGSHHLREQRVGIKRDPRNDAIQFLRWKIRRRLLRISRGWWWISTRLLRILLLWRILLLLRRILLLLRRILLLLRRILRLLLGILLRILSLLIRRIRRRLLRILGSLRECPK